MVASPRAQFHRIAEPPEVLAAVVVLLAIASKAWHDEVMPALNVGSLGEFLRDQRKSAQMSLRQLAEQAGVSNPYLSQIERGLRKPSAEILQQIAKGLRISAEQLYVRAGILDERTESDLAVESALIADPAITERQKRALLEIYRSFRAENLRDEHEARTTDEGDN